MRSLLNDYESMLATSTCNCLLHCALPATVLTGNVQFVSLIREAWRRTVHDWPMLQIMLVPAGEFGVLGPRYKAVESPSYYEGMDHLVRISNVSDAAVVLSDDEALLAKLQENGTSMLDLSKGSYFLDCLVENDADDGTINAAFFLTLSHAVSDGPGSLHVANDFLRNLSNTIAGTPHEPSSSPPRSSSKQDLVDLQSILLTDSYGKDLEERGDCYLGLDDFKNIIAGDDPGCLAPEATQNLPSDPGFGGPSKIDCVGFSLTIEQTAALRERCRPGTVQGAISVVSLLTRLKLLGHNAADTIKCALQIPVNCRAFASTASESCLCGSAGIWHTIDILPESSVLDLVAQASRKVKNAVNDEQHTEWLRRLMNNPSSLPPYSLMVSSIGVAPIDEEYGKVKVKNVKFFGGALTTDAPSKVQSTMSHVVTFGGRLALTLSFTSPGVSKGFAKETIKLLEALLIQIANGSLEIATCEQILAVTKM